MRLKATNAGEWGSLQSCLWYNLSSELMCHEVVAPRVSQTVWPLPRLRPSATSGQAPAAARAARRSAALVRADGPRHQGLLYLRAPVAHRQNYRVADRRDGFLDLRHRAERRRALQPDVVSDAARVRLLRAGAARALGTADAFARRAARRLPGRDHRPVHHIKNRAKCQLHLRLPLLLRHDV